MNTPSTNTKNVLNSDVELKGTLKFSGDLTFDGKIDGDINSEGTLHLGENAVLKGNINVNSVVMRGKINGNVKRDISSHGTLNLGDNAVVKGNITVNSVVMRGKVNGNVTAREKIDIKSKTELFGDIRAPRLVMEEGVTFVGQTEVNPNKVT